MNKNNIIAVLLNCLHLRLACTVIFTFIIAISTNVSADGSPALASNLPATENKEAPVWKLEKDKAVTEARNGQYDTALSSLNDLHKKYPQEKSVTSDLIAVSAWAGHDNDAVTLYENSQLDASPDYVLEAVAHAYRNLKKPDAALAVYNKGLSQSPNSPIYATGVVRSLTDMGQLGEATSQGNQLLNKINATDLTSAVDDANRQYYGQLAHDGKFTNALDILHNLRTKYPADEKLAWDEMTIYSWSGDDKKAIELYEAASKKENAPDYTLDAVGHSYRNLHQPAKAAAVYELALQQYPDNEKFMLGEVSGLIESDHTEEAISKIHTALNKKPQNEKPFLDYLNSANQKNAIILARHGHTQESLKQLKELYRQQPNNPTVVSDYITILDWAGQSQEAIAVYNAHVNMHLEDYALLAVGHANREIKQPQQAIQVYKKILAKSPGNEAAKVGVIRSLIDLNRYSEASAVAEADIKLHGLRLEVLLAGGEAYHDAKQFKEAARFFNLALNKFPSSEAAAAGVIRNDIDLKLYKEAEQLAEENLKKYGSRLQILLLAAEATDKEDKIYESLAYAERANELATQNPDTIRTLIHEEQRVGMPQLALKLADAHNNLIPPQEHRAIEGDLAASYVRYGDLEPLSESKRFMETDHAIAVLDKQIKDWSVQGNITKPEVTRARIDRIVAYANRIRMKDVIAEYESLHKDGVTLPPYAMAPVGDAYMYVRQPETARDVYLDVLKHEPDNFEVKRQLFFAYVECDDFKDAYALVDKNDKQQPIWIYQKGDPERLENLQRLEADRDVGNAHLYAGELQVADNKLSAAENAAPFNAKNRSALGDLYLTRGLPRHAEEQFAIGTNLQEGQDVDSETGMALAELDTRAYQQTELHINNLMTRFPELLEVQRADRLWQVHNDAELDVDAFYNFRPTNAVQGGAGYGTDAMIYSPPINYNWRIFAGTGFRHEEEPNNEGNTNYSRSILGLEYRDTNMIVSVGPTYNYYTTFGYNSYDERVGVDAKLDWNFDDKWSAGGEYALFTNDIPLRALNSGVTADRYAAYVEWRENESREARLDSDIMSFSDDNTRFDSNFTYAQRLYTTPYYRIDALSETGITADSLDENRSYFNPGLEFIELAGLRGTQVLYRRYETLYEHSLTVLPLGYDWQRDYGSAPAWQASYEQDYTTNDIFTGKWGLYYTRQDYDSQPENNFSIMINAVGRF